MKVFVTLLTGIQGQREGVYEVDRDFLKRQRPLGVPQIATRSLTESLSSRWTTIPSDFS